MSKPSELKILSMNVCGFGNKKKRNTIINHLERFKPTIICLSDTRLDKNSELLMRNEFQYHCYFNSLTSNSRGVAIMINKSAPINVNNIMKDDSGNWISINFDYESKSLNLINIYGPNEDNPAFFENLFERIGAMNMMNHIVTGDFNTTLDPAIDNSNYIGIGNNRARVGLNQQILDYNFIDSFRFMNGNIKSFTWYRRGGDQKSRLDMFLTSNSLGPNISDARIVPSLKSDHCPIILGIDFAKFRSGRGLWRFDDSLLRDETYIDRVKKSIRETCAKYLQHDIYGNFFQECTNEELATFNDNNPEELQRLNYNIDPNLMLEMLCNDIKNVTISYSVRKRRELNREENDLFKNLSTARDNIEGDNVTIEQQERLATLEMEYNTFMEEKSREQILTRNRQMKSEGEKPTRYFCNLEKHIKNQKYIPKLEITKNGEKSYITNQAKIEKELRQNYLELFSNKDDCITIQNIDDFVGQNVEYNKLTDQDAQEMEGEITELELGAILKKCKNSSAPGSTGFNYSFYKFFWKDLKTFINKAAKFSFDNGALPTSQRYGIISVIPKSKKNKELLSNWRPLTLLNCIYKIISGAIAKRINNKLSKIINGDQCGFVQGRFIGDCIRTTNDILEWAKKNNKVGLLLLIDFTKAFDSISFNYIAKTLNFFGFGNDIKRWVWILLNNFSASTIHAGNISESFNILRGCRQGDPLAPPLFILAIEILCIKLRSTANIKGYKMDNLEFLLSLYADDCTIFLEYDEDNLRNTITVLENFYHLSGLKIHVGKTQCIIFGEKPERNIKLCPDLGLKWESEFMLLGIKFDSYLEKMEKNFDEKMDEIDNVINNWQYRNLTPLGRCCIAKTLLLSKLSHLAIVLPSLKSDKINIIERKLYNFIWQGSDKVARKVAKIPITLGGLNFPDIKASWKAFKMAWFRRIVRSDAKWKLILEKLLEPCNITSIEDIFLLGTADFAKLVKQIKSNFWSEAFSVVKPFMLELVKRHPEEILNCTIWGSDMFTRNQSLTNKRHFPGISNKIQFPTDILKDTGMGLEFISEAEYELIYGHCNVNEYISLKYLIATSLRKVGADINTMYIIQPTRPTMLTLINLTDKGCSRWTSLLKGSYVTDNVRLMEIKWSTRLQSIQSLNFWNQCYKNVKNIFFSNKLRWFYYQIVRGCLKTNYIVSIFKPLVNAECTFCGTELETILHLFWECTLIKPFVDECRVVINRKIDFVTEMDRIDYIFGIRNEEIFSQLNYYLLHLKYFIWINRCNETPVSVQGFISWFIFEMRLDQAHDNDNLFFINDLIFALS